MLSSKSQFSVLNDQFFKWQIGTVNLLHLKNAILEWLNTQKEMQRVPALILRMLCNEHSLHGRSSTELYLL